MSVGPQNLFCERLHAEKYRQPGENFREAMNRVAASLKDDDPHFHEFRDVLLDMRFMPAGRVQAAMGAARRVTPYNCFVSGTIADSFVDGDGSIMARATQAATTMRLGGGIGYDFSSLRPRGALIRKLNSNSSGPLGFMPIFNEVCKATSSAGNRRGAQMGVLRIDHPDIMEFIHAKQNTTELTGFNISTAVTNEFMEALSHQRPYKLRFGNQYYGELDSVQVWETLMRSTWDWAEPGVLFIDTINEMNNLYYCEKIAATNPCGEQPLPPFGACLLGSFNLVKYLVKTLYGWDFDWDRFINDIPSVIRAMDNIVDRAVYPLHEQEQEAVNKRRMGIGVTGLANCLETIGFPYGSSDFIHFENRILDILRDEAYSASALLAAEKGSFPLFDYDLFSKGKFFATLGDKPKELIKKYGLRNSHLLSIAPTGTISMAADNPSSSIEPVFSVQTDRTVIMPEGSIQVSLPDYAYQHFGTKPKTTDQVTIDEHLNVLLSAANRVDSAVSKTCNVPPTIRWEDFKSIYTRAWEGGAKGCTTFNIGGKRMALLVAKPKEVEEDVPTSCTFDPESGRKSCE